MNEKQLLFEMEANSARLERTIVRLWVLLILMLIMLVGTNGAWIYYESQFMDVETTTIEAQQDGSGTNMISGGDLNYGAEGQNN